MLQDALRILGFGLCHQLPERSFFGGGLQAPVCARDTGIYMGFAIAALLLVALGRRRRTSGLPPLGVALLSLVFVGAMAYDGVTSYAGLRSTSNEIRLLTGLLTGFATATYTIPLAAETLLRRPGRDRVLGRPYELAAWILAIPLAFAAIRWLLPLTGALYPLIVAASILFAFTTVNLVIVGVFRPFDRSVERFADLIKPGGIAFVLTVIEVGGAAALRQVLLGG